MAFGSRSKLQKVDYEKKILLGTRPLKFTDKYKYLGGTLDSEMTLIIVLADTKKTVLQRLFNLRKLRYYKSEKGALVIY